MGGENEKEVKLVGAWFDPYVHRVACVLKLKGIPFEFVQEKLNNKSSSLLLDVYKEKPVLVHHGKPVVGSLLIVEYIDETWKHNPILPIHPYDRAVARFWANYIDQMILKAMLHNKIYSQNPGRTSSTKKYLEDKQTPERQKYRDEKQERKSEDGCKWVKTDSEYIVLEI